MLNNLLKKLKNTKIVKFLWLEIRCVHRFGLLLGINIFTDLWSSHKDLVKFTLPGYPHPIFIRGGTSDKEVFETVFIANRFDVKIKNSNSRTIQIVDAGANIGLVSLFLNKQYPNSSIWCIEPEVGNLEILDMNVKDYSNITVIPAALWKNNDSLNLIDPGRGNWSYQVEASRSSDSPIPSITMMDVLERINGDIDILKMDIEGSEKEVFEMNSEEWLGKIKVLIIEIHEGMKPGTDSTIHR